MLVTENVMTINNAAFRLRDLAVAVAATGVPLSIAHQRLQSYVKKGLLRVRVRGRNTSPNLFAREDMAVALILSAFVEAGAHLPIITAASKALYADGVLEAASNGALWGQEWVCRVWMTRDDQNRTVKDAAGALIFNGEVARRGKPKGFEVVMNPMLKALSPLTRTEDHVAEGAAYECL